MICALSVTKRNRLWYGYCSYSGENLAIGEQNMNWDQIAGQWKQFKGKVKEQWGDLTDNDLDVIEGKKDQLSGKLQERYGYTKEQAEHHIRAWEQDVRP
jgi:uncharacterized protein YjbJ (UPF0337 family)